MHLPGFGLEHSLEWPPIEVRETEYAVQIEASLAGVDKRDVQLFIDGGKLVIAGERSITQVDRDFSAGERFYGRFERRIAIPARVQSERITAELKNGVLKVTIPKRLDDATNRIAVDSQ